MSSLKKQWSDTKKLYEQTVNKKKPSVDFLSFVTRRGTGVASGLGAYDDALASYEQNRGKASSNTEALFAAMQKAGNAAVKAMGEYEKVLAGRTKADKLTDPVYTGGLDVLRKDLDAMSHLITERIKAAQAEQALAEKIKKAKSSDEIVAATNAHHAKRWKGDAANAIKRLAAATAKAKPDPATYQTVLHKPLRDISYSFGNNNLDMLGLGKLAKSSTYPDKAINFLNSLYASKTELKTADEVAKVANAIGPQLTVVAAWFNNVAKHLT